MNFRLIFILFLPTVVFGQHVLDFTNEPLIYWSQINNVGSLTTEYKDDFSSDGRFIEKIKEELLFNPESQTVRQFRSFRTFLDTTQYAKIHTILLGLEPDTTYTNYEDLTTSVFTTIHGKYAKSYLLDQNGLIIFEKLYPWRLKPIYLKYLENEIQLNEDGNIVKHLVHRIFGRNDWEFHFDTLSYQVFGYTPESMYVNSWTKEILSDNYEAVSATMVKKNSVQKSFPRVDTLSIDSTELSLKILQSYFGPENLNSLNKIVHRTYVEYFDSYSGKKITRKPPFSRHNKFNNSNFGYQETSHLKDGMHLKNYLITDTSDILIEIIHIDENGRVQNYYRRGFDYQNKPAKWLKLSYEYIGSYPFLVTYYEPANRPLKNPERHWFKKIGTENTFENWLSSSYRFINDSNFELIVNDTKYSVIINE